jgi:hypothetical protein
MNGLESVHEEGRKTKINKAKAFLGSKQRKPNKYEMNKKK